MLISSNSFYLYKRFKEYKQVRKMKLKNSAKVILIHYGKLDKTTLHQNKEIENRYFVI